MSRSLDECSCDREIHLWLVVHHLLLSREASCVPAAWCRRCHQHHHRRLFVCLFVWLVEKHAKSVVGMSVCLCVLCRDVLKHEADNHGIHGQGSQANLLEAYAKSLGCANHPPIAA